MVKTDFTQLIISSQNLIHNYNYFKSKLKPQTKLLVLIKANSYGHGAIEIAKILEKENVDYFGIAHPIEGIELRKAGITTPILVLTAGLDHFNDITSYKLTPSIPSIESLKLFNEYTINNNIKNYPIHIKIDTGMHRLGFMNKQIDELCNFLSSKECNIKVEGVFSHFAASDEPQHDSFTLGQIDLYKRISDRIEECLKYKFTRHILNSAGIERFSEYQFDMVRLGIGIYGISSIDQSLLKPIIRLESKIIQIKELDSSDGTVGYGRRSTIISPTKIATIALGYADGIDRHLGRGNAKFCVNGKLAPTIGNICMDMCMIDITGIDAKLGDYVTIFGEKPSAIDLAKILDTIPYEIFTSVSKRISRIVE